MGSKELERGRHGEGGREIWSESKRSRHEETTERNEERSGVRLRDAEEKQAQREMKRDKG